MSVFEELNEIQKIDKGNMYKAVSGFPDQMKDAVTIAEGFSVDTSKYEGITRIVLCGMGGSAIGGDFVKSLLADELTIPFEVCRDYTLPNYCDQNTLVIGSSYSGNTEETLAAFKTAIEKGCRLFVLTTGGQLEALAKKHGIPVVKPREGFQPRAALSYSFTLLLLFCNKIGLTTYGSDALNAAAKFLKQRIQFFSIDNPIESCLTKQLAEKLVGRVPIIYSGPGLTAPVAVRFAGQLSENAKILAFSNQFPEFNHNQLVGYETADMYRDSIFVIVLRDKDDNQRVQKRMDIVEGLIAEKEIDVVEIESVGETKLERVLSLVQVADFTSFYLAIKLGVDPTPVNPIEALKQALKG
ncbi:MAG: bifunctional phosphoglucose/phosphomannose isomerase [Candidatus Zixiibacteriota bacterium]